MLGLSETRLIITKTYLYNSDPLKPHLYIVKLGFTGVYIIFLISAQNKDCGYPLEPPHRGGSNEYPHSMFWAEMWKISEFLSEQSWVFWWWNFQYICIGVFFVMVQIVSSVFTGCLLFCLDTIWKGLGARFFFLLNLHSALSIMIHQPYYFISLFITKTHLY